MLFHIFHTMSQSYVCMMTSSNGNIFRVTGPLCGEFTGPARPGEFPTQRPVTRSFDVFFDLRLNKRLSKQLRGWWFETQSWSLWRHCNGGSSFLSPLCWVYVLHHMIVRERVLCLHGYCSFQTSYLKYMCSAQRGFYGGPEGTSQHKFFIALHKFWLARKKYYGSMYT